VIIGPDFIWLHFPKTGGSATEAVLRTLLPDATFDPIDPSAVIWHHLIRDRLQYDPTFSPEGKRIICGFRRLPHWLLSRVHFEASWPPHRLVTRAMLVEGRLFEHDGTVTSPDVYARAFTSYPVDDWIRAENAADDIATAFHLDAGAVRAALERKNPTPPYPTSLDFWFTPAELAGLYAACPLWARLEE